MTAPEGHVDPEIQAQWDRAERALARRLSVHMVEHTANTVAARFMRDMKREGFKPPLRPANPFPDPPEDPVATTARGVELARQHLGLDQPDERDLERG